MISCVIILFSWHQIKKLSCSVNITFREISDISGRLVKLRISAWSPFGNVVYEQQIFIKKD